MKLVLTISVLILSMLQICMPLHADGNDESRQMSIAILGFHAEEGGSMPILTIIDTLSTEMQKSGRFRLVERARIEKILKEQHIDNIYAEPDKAAQIGNLLGAQYVIYGDIENLSCQAQDHRDKHNNVSYSVAAQALVHYKMTNVESGEIFCEDRITGKSGTGFLMNMPQSPSYDQQRNFLLQACEDSVDPFVKEIPPPGGSGKIIGIRNGEVIINLGKRDGVGMDSDIGFYRLEVLDEKDTATGKPIVIKTSIAYKDKPVIGRPVQIESTYSVLQVGRYKKSFPFNKMSFDEDSKLSEALKNGDRAIQTARPRDAK